MQTYADYKIEVFGDGKVRVSYTPTDKSGDIEDADSVPIKYLSQAISDSALVSTGDYNEQTIHKLGELLYRILFPRNVESHFREAFRQSTSQGHGLRIRIDIDEELNPELAVLPWEFLRRPSDNFSPGFWFGTHSKLVLSRYKAVREVSETLDLSDGEKIRIMLVSASPEELSKVNHEATYLSIVELVDLNKVAFDPNPRLITNTTPRILDEELYNYRPHILHVIAHGRVANNQGEIALVNLNGKSARWYQAEEFGALFESWTPGLVFLQACESATESPERPFISLGIQVVKGNIPVVVAMKYTVTNRIASLCAERFYQALGKNEPLDSAMQNARRAIGRDYGYSSRDFAVPTLFMRVRDGKFANAVADNLPVNIDALKRRKTKAIDNQSLGSGTDKTAYVIHNLPVRLTENFVGRSAIAQQIISLLSFDSARHVVVIDGAGGIGKTTLALEIAYQYVDANDQTDPSNFEAIIWSSARTSLLTAEGVIPREKGINTVYDIYALIALTLDRQDIIRAEQNEQVELVRQALLRQRTLIIIDNYETMEDQRVLSFIEELPQTVKVLITTRRRLGFPNLIHLKELNREDSIKLIELECQKRIIDLDEDRILRLYELVGGTPLAIVWSVAQIAYGFGVDATLSKLEEASGDIIGFCFSHSMDHIVGDKARRIMLALSLFASDAERAALLKVADLDENAETDMYLAKLEQLSLVERDNSRYRLLPLTKRLMQYELGKSLDFMDSARARLLQSFYDYLEKQEPILWEHGIPKLIWQREVDNLRDIIHWCQLHQRWADYLALVTKSGAFWFTYGHWNELMGYAQSAFDIINQQDAKTWGIEQFGIIIHVLRMYIHSDAPEKAMPYMKAASEILSSVTIMPEHLIESYKFIRGALAARLDQSDADEILRESVEYARKTGIPWRIAGAIGWLGVLEFTRQNWAQAEQHLREAISIADRTNDARTASFIYSYLSTAIYKQGRLEEADKSFRKGVAIADQYAEDHNRGHIYAGMAQLQFDLRNLDEAAIYCQEAITIYSKIGLKRRKSTVEDLQQRITLLTKERQDQRGEYYEANPD